MTVTTIAGGVALAKFRQQLTGEYGLELLREAQGRLLVQLPVGVGKSVWQTEIIRHALATRTHDLVIALAPRRDILNELVQRLGDELDPLVLMPRPGADCGSLDAAWRSYEQRGMGALGRAELCGQCPLRSECHWPNQFAGRLLGARLILAAQQHLAINPALIDWLSLRTGARRVLVLIDEADILLRPTSIVISRDELTGFLRAIETAELPGSLAATSQRWLDRVDLLTRASTTDLHGSWGFPVLNHGWALRVQQAGERMLPGSFRFIGFDLRSLAASDRTSRERLPNGDLRFARPAALGTDFIVFAGGMTASLARYRLDPSHAAQPLLSPFEDYQFVHPDSRWYNLRSLTGTAKFFLKNAPAILDFFAARIAANVRAGKRTLLVARKKFVDFCAEQLQVRLTQLLGESVQIVTADWRNHAYGSAAVIPLINYGVSGINLFEDFDAAYCLTGYYTNAAAVARVVHDVEPEAHRWPVEVEFTGSPRRRIARVNHTSAAHTILPAIAQAALQQREADVVIQAVGRVRPFTRPREVITFQADQLPRVEYTVDFGSLAQARQFFGVASRRQAARNTRQAEALALRERGLSHAQIAAHMSISKSTVKRYLKTQAGVTKPICIYKKAS